ncbi:hypothetical protein P3S67_014351 [Capsicum chacoense]
MTFDFVIKKANGLKDLVDTDLQTIPNQCIQPKEQRPDKSQQISCFFFQIIDHGIPIEVLEDLKDAAHKFFELPAEEKVKYYKENAGPDESVLLYWSAIGEKNERILEWRDSIKHGCNPQNDSNLWPPQTRKLTKFLTFPLIYKNQVLEFQKWAIPLAKSYGTSLNGNYDYQHKLLSTMPKSSITIGCRRHCDVSYITLLLQDDTGGLYVRGTKGDNWIHVNPIKGTLAINIGDSLQIMSHDRYKSIEHCMSVDSNRARISIPFFVNPSLDSATGPFPQLLKDGEKSVLGY